MKQNLPLSCIIPTFNGQQLLQKHLPSVLAALSDGDQLIISDDASTDTSLAWLKKEFNLVPVTNAQAPHSQVFKGSVQSKSKSITVVTLIHNANVRFAESVNRAVEICNTPYFFLVNNDVSVKKDAIAILRKQIQSDDTIFAIGCLEYENTEAGHKSGKNLLWFEKGLFQHSRASDFTSGPTAWASGGSAIFSTKKWLDLKGFDTAYYPAYWEDTDISFRARKKGWKVLFNQEAVVFHKHETTNTDVFGQSFLEQISWNNAFVFTWKHASFAQKLEFLLFYPYWLWQRLKRAK